MLENLEHAPIGDLMALPLLEDVSFQPERR